MSSRKRSAEARAIAASEAGALLNVQTTRAVESALGQNIAGDFLPSDMFGAASDLLLHAAQQPMALAKATLGF